MSDIEIGNVLYSAAENLIKARYPEGWGGAAALRTHNGEILTSVAPDAELDALHLCMEVGACLEAHKIDQKITHSLCLCRETPNSEFLILSPCGICLERLSHWGGAVLVAITNPENELKFRALREMLPDHWSQVNGKVL